MLTKMIQEYEDLKKEFNLKIQGELEKQLRIIMSEMPEELSVSWTQYTPYFNDGDTCEFNANTYDMCPQVNGEELWDEEEGVIPDTTITFKQAFHIAEVIQKIVEQIPDDMLLDAYGDHAEVSISKKGVEVSEYDHD